jgi:hypothetical protein
MKFCFIVSEERAFIRFEIFERSSKAALVLNEREESSYFMKRSFCFKKMEEKSKLGTYVSSAISNPF